MTKREKDLQRILDGRYDSNIDFALLVAVLLRLGFEVRIRGSHHLFRKPGTAIEITLAAHGKRVAAYQVRQIRRVILESNLAEQDE